MKNNPSNTQLWTTLKTELQKLFPTDIFNTWFQPLSCLENTLDNTMTLETSNDFEAMWLQNNYKEILENKLMALVGFSVTIEFKSKNNPDYCAPIPTVNSPMPRNIKTAGPSSQLASGQGLNPQNTFENFVVGAGSQLAHAAAVAIANAPAKAYNPLFLYGNTGLGKTHLMHAVGHHILRHQPNTNVIYISTERFTNDFIYAIQENQLARFRKKYRSSDVLLIDDIHFLSGKERIQEEFFHTFNELFESQKQIFLCSDRPASEITKLENRLISRFQWGLVCDIQPPDFETRVAILSKKAQSMHLSLDESVLAFLAERVTKNVRRMEGALNRILGYQRLLHTDKLTIENVEKILEDILQEEMSATVTMDDIQKRVCDFYHISLSDMVSKKRPANIAFPRQVAMYLCRVLTSTSLQEIGAAFGGRDHGTVIHACKSVENVIQQEPTTKRTIQFLQQKLLSK
ncbi:MAG: chromosomal replication initiator protein DnaA [Puniceicoccales bacterium]|jgi:chromosomal replication initiator protein|nr:chromosomal replication initiator protein DnaA [Puniceicoccales bacterium]